MEKKKRKLNQLHWLCHCFHSRCVVRRSAIKLNTIALSLSTLQSLLDKLFGNIMINWLGTKCLLLCIASPSDHCLCEPTTKWRVVVIKCPSSTSSLLSLFIPKSQIEINIHFEQLWYFFLSIFLFFVSIWCHRLILFRRNEVKRNMSTTKYGKKDEKRPTNEEAVEVASPLFLIYCETVYLSVVWIARCVWVRVTASWVCCGCSLLVCVSLNGRAACITVYIHIIRYSYRYKLFCECEHE